MSRASKQGSTVSRNQSLIKKNVAPQDLRPSSSKDSSLGKLLLSSLSLISKCVLNIGMLRKLMLCQGIADIENNTAKELTKLGAVIQVPFRSGNQFLGEGGLQVGMPRYMNQGITF